MNELKDHLGNIARDRGWSGPDADVTKTVYGVVGKKTVKIDRRGGNGGTLSFAL
jgi:hypothetical protein